MYYLLGRTSKPRRWMDDTPYIKGVKWWRGAVITAEVPDPLEFTLQPYQPSSPDDDQFMGALLEDYPPVWRDDFIEALRECGVHNFDTYNVAITNPSNAAFMQELRDEGIDDYDDSYLDPGGIITNYKAVNVLGLVAAADMQKSVATVHDGIPLIDVDFDSLVIDEKKTKGIKMFRLAESTNAVLVHETVRDALLAKGYGDDVAFWDPREAAI